MRDLVYTWETGIILINDESIVWGDKFHESNQQIDGANCSG